MRDSRGFTLIELLVVVVIIGILAAIAVPKFATSKERAYVAGMKSDLRNLVAAEESYFAEYVTYAGSVANLNYNVSTGNTVNLISITATGTGWSATATNTGTAQTCGIYVGNATPPFPGQYEGQPVCK